MEERDLEYINELLQRGGGKTTMTITPRKLRLLQLFQTSGWNRSFLRSHFENFEDSMLEDWTNNRFIEKYTQFLARKLAVETNSRSIFEILKSIGLHSRLAKQADVACQPLVGFSYSFLQVLDCAIEYVLKKWKPMTSVNVPYFLEPTLQNEWIPYEGKQIWNLPFTCYEPLTNIKNYMLRYFPPQRYFYHTTTWAYLKYIFRRINHRRGRPCLDFGYSSGFYMSETLSDCVQWGTKNTIRWNNEIAIVIFQLPRLSEIYSQLKVKNLSGAQWSHIVKASRDCESDDDLVFEIDSKFDFIYGPMLANTDSYNTVGTLTHSPSKMQLTSKSDNADLFLTNHILGALVFRKPTKN